MLYSNGACTRTCNHAKMLYHPSQSFSSKSNSVSQPARHWNEMKVPTLPPNELTNNAMER